MFDNDPDVPLSFIEECRLVARLARERATMAGEPPSATPPQTGSLAETVPGPTTDEPAPRTQSPPRTGSLSETVPRPTPAPNPWIRTPADQERDATTERIGELVTRWELGTVHRIHALAAHLGFGVREFLVLSELVVRPAGLTGAELIGVVGGSAARMSVLLTGLVERGLVERGPDLWDGRSMLAGATDKAHELLPHEAPYRLARRTGQELPRQEQLAAVARFVTVAAEQAYADGRYLRDLRYRPRRS